MIIRYLVFTQHWIYELHRNLYKICVFLWRSSIYRPVKSVLHVRSGWIIHQKMRETREKKVMKFKREIPIGLDARRKNRQGGGHNGPPPMGLGLRIFTALHWLITCSFTPFLSLFAVSIIVCLHVMFVICLWRRFC